MSYIITINIEKVINLEGDIENSMTDSLYYKGKQCNVSELCNLYNMEYIDNQHITKMLSLYKKIKYMEDNNIWKIENTYLYNGDWKSINNYMSDDYGFDIIDVILPEKDIEEPIVTDGKCKNIIPIIDYHNTQNGYTFISSDQNNPIVFEEE